jgi:hypothetical protein
LSHQRGKKSQTKQHNTKQTKIPHEVSQVQMQYIFRERRRRKEGRKKKGSGKEGRRQEGRTEVEHRE